MITYDVQQRSFEWFTLRKGVITASNAHRLLTPAKRKTYQIELLAEILTGTLTEHYISEAMQWGIDYEDEAIDEFKDKHGKLLPEFSRVGFCKSELIPNIGCSPDFLIGEDSLGEVKCLSSKNHLEAYLNSPDVDHIAQIQFQLLVTGRDTGIYVGYDPRMPTHELKIYWHPIYKDEKLTSKIKEGIDEVNGFIDDFLMERGLNR